MNVSIQFIIIYYDNKLSKMMADVKYRSNFLLISNATNIARIDPYTIGRYMYTSLNSYSLENVSSLAVDISMYTVYYYDSNYNIISSAKIDNLHLGLVDYWNMWNYIDYEYNTIFYTSIINLITCI